VDEKAAQMEDVAYHPFHPIAPQLRLVRSQPAPCPHNHVVSKSPQQRQPYVRFYDARGGGVETSFKDDKQGLGLTKRSKKRFSAQLGKQHRTVVEDHLRR
jgi:hypothetical protein